MLHKMHRSNTISIHINNTKFCKGFKAIKNKQRLCFQCRFLLLITFYVMLIIFLVPELNLVELNYLWKPYNVKTFGATSIVVISMFSIELLLIVCMVVLNNDCYNVYPYLNYTMIILLQVGMTDTDAI